MSAEEFHAHICRGYEDYLAGRVRPAEEVSAEFRERLKQRGVEPACQQEQCHQKWDDFRRLRHNVWVFYDLPGSGTSSPEHLSMTMAKRLSRLRKP